MNTVNRFPKLRKLPVYFLLIAVTMVIVFPLAWMLILSFKSNAEIFSTRFSLPKSILFDNYIRAFHTLDFVTLYKNTIIIVVITIAVDLVITFSSSFAISRMVFKNRKLQDSIYNFFLAGLAIPSFILLFPVYKITVDLHLFGTYFSLVLPYIATSIAFNTLLFTGFLKGIPNEIDEAAIIDGCSLFRLCATVIVPIIKPVVATVLIFNVLYVWNEYPFAVTLINDPSMYTISLGTSFFKGEWSADYAAIAASGVVIIIPQLIFYSFFQKYIIEGMTAGAVKG